MLLTADLRRALHAGVVLVSAASFAACVNPNRQVYDPDGNQSRRWNRAEERAYRRWEQERRMPDVEYSRRAAADQRAYWQWRRDHPDR